MTKTVQKAESYEKDFHPRYYLDTYYSGQKMNEDEVMTYKYMLDYLKTTNRHFSKMLEVGCGPTLHNVIPFTSFVDEIHMADYLPNNLEQIQLWLDNHPNAHNWDVYIKTALEMEDNMAETAIDTRKKNMRDQITTLKHIDLHNDYPLEDRESYPLVISFYCAASATSTKEEWAQFMKGIFKLISPGGILIVGDFRHTNQYFVGKTLFQNANIDEDDMADLLNSSDFETDSIDIQSLTFSGSESIGLSDFMLAKARKIT
jgi:nicotinamide N-methyltransferase/methyltransferase